MRLIITEKYNAAQRISTILSDGSWSRATIHDTPVFEWDNTKCIGLAGHVVELDFIDEYRDWGNVDPADLIEAQITTKASKPQLVKAVLSLATDASELVIATDYDREGELIGKEAIDLVKQEAGDDLTIQRARFSSLTNREVKQAFSKYDDVEYALALAGRSRQIIDLRWGASLTRYLTLSAPGDSGLLSVGRVQTPTLNLLVQRESEIEQFDPTDYWEIKAYLNSGNGSTFESEFYYLDNENNEATRLWDEEKANTIYTAVSQAKHAPVQNEKTYTKNDYPPAPFNTTEFIKAANAIGFDANPAMAIAEKLYNSGYITYPRTENTVYPDDFNPEKLLDELSTLDEFEHDTENLLDKTPLSPTRGDTESTDHPPIHPTLTPPPNIDELSSREWEIYELVVRRFFATVADPAEWIHRRIDFEINGHKLKANGKQLSHLGYHDYYPYFNTSETDIPNVAEGDSLPISGVNIESKQTEPPSRYGQSKLIDKMEGLGLGTKSTRHNIIDKLIDREYITTSPLSPTPLGRLLCRVLENQATEVTTPEMTATLKENMDAIAAGDSSLTTVTENSQEMLRDIFDDIQSSDQEITSTLQTHFEEHSEELTEEDAIGNCPECGELLFPKETSSGNQFVGCDGYPDCQYTLPLPNKGRVYLMDDICTKHEFHNVKMIAGKKTHVFGCPKCKEIEAEESNDQVIGSCPSCGDSDGGNLAITRVQTGSRLLGCTRYPDCEYSEPLPREGDIHISDTLCDVHGLPHLIIEKEEYDSPWELGCPICS